MVLAMVPSRHFASTRLNRGRRNHHNGRFRARLAGCTGVTRCSGIPGSACSAGTSGIACGTGITCSAGITGGTRAALCAGIARATDIAGGALWTCRARHRALQNDGSGRHRDNCGGALTGSQTEQEDHGQQGWEG